MLLRHSIGFQKRIADRSFLLNSLLWKVFILKIIFRSSNYFSVSLFSVPLFVPLFFPCPYFRDMEKIFFSSNDTERSWVLLFVGLFNRWFRIRFPAKISSLEFLNVFWLTEEFGETDNSNFETQIVMSRASFLGFSLFFAN